MVDWWVDETMVGLRVLSMVEVSVDLYFYQYRIMCNLKRDLMEF